MAKLTPEGYQLKTQNDWFQEERDFYKAIDPLWNLDPSTPDGLKLAHDAEVFGALDELIQQAYNSKDPAKAKGYDLDVICELTRTPRNLGTPSQAVLTLTGASGTSVPAGTVIESVANGSRWATDQTVTLDSSGGSVGVTCSKAGPTQADADTLTKIVTTVGGLSKVTNPSPATLGASIQSDESLRIARRRAVGRAGSNQVDSTIGELLAVKGVRRVRALENDTGITDDNGLPPHSMAYIVDGGSNNDVAMAIYLKKNPGCPLYAAGTPVHFDVVSPRYPTNIKRIVFSRPIGIDIQVAVTIKSDGSLPLSVEEEIKQAIIEFGAGTLIDPDLGFVSDGFDIGESVPYFTMSTPINKVIGGYGNSYIKALTLNGGTDSVDVPFNSLARWSAANVEVVIE